MRLSDIFKCIAQKIDNKFPAITVYGESVKQGLKMPCFFVYLVPLINESGQYMRQRGVSVKIVYLQEHKDIELLYEMADEIESLFDLSLLVNTETGIRALTIPRTGSQIIDGDLHFTFTVEFFEGKVIEDYAEMQHLSFEMEG